MIYKNSVILILLIILPLIRLYQFKCTIQQENWKKQPRMYLNEIEVMTPTAHNFRIIVDLSDLIVSKNILEKGTWEPQIMFLISQFLKKGHTALNLGSHIGFEAILIGNIIGQSGKLFLFQPYSRSYRIAVKNIYLNGIQKISTVYNLGAGMARSKQKLWIDHQNTGHSSILLEEQLKKDYEQIIIDRVDSVLPPDTILDFALIDVERYQVQALIGMKQILRRSPKIFIIVEWRYMNNKNRNQSRTIQLLGQLESEGFKWYKYQTETPCALGHFQKIQWHQLLKITELDLILLGSQANLKQLRPQ